MTQPEQLLTWIWGTRSLTTTPARRLAMTGDIDYYLFTGKQVLDVTSLRSPDR
ncbi:hypothetical protein MJ561_10040 [Klebsiella pneumoniae]|nr:hypothetical protein MJ561_10040 [Klebsiella pneumoniae]